MIRFNRQKIVTRDYIERDVGFPVVERFAGSIDLSSGVAFISSWQ